SWSPSIHDQTIAGGNRLGATDRTVLETRGQFARGDLSAPPSDLIGPAVNIAGCPGFGRLSGSPTGRVNNLYQVVNNVSHQIGGHAFRGGVDVVYNNDRITFPRSVRGAYAFSSLANFLTGTYNNAGFTQTFGATQVAQTNSNVAVFAQDEWKATSRITVNLGVRHDLQFLDTIRTDLNNVSPRLGVAWSPSGSGGAAVGG